MTPIADDIEHPLIISSGKVHLDGILHVPHSARGLVLFAHGSGSSRFSVRNQQVAKLLNQHQIATLLFDLLTPEEEVVDERSTELRFDIEFLASRLMDASLWCGKQAALKDLKLAYFGASTGGGAALVAAAKQSATIRAVVSRGGRPDLAGKYLHLVQAPTLLIVGALDKPVIKMNEKAQSLMTCTSELQFIPGATHLFEEDGALDQVAQLASAWFEKYL